MVIEIPKQVRNDRIVVIKDDSTFVRRDNVAGRNEILSCHPEFISGSRMFEGEEILKQVQHDNNVVQHDNNMVQNHNNVVPYDKIVFWNDIKKGYE